MLTFVQFFMMNRLEGSLTRGKKTDFNKKISNRHFYIISDPLLITCRRETTKTMEIDYKL